MTPVFLTIVGLLLIGGLALLWMKRPRVGGAKRRGLLKKWEAVVSQPDLEKRVLQADAVVCDALGMLGYTGSMGERMQSAGPRLKNLQDLWSAHKLRNRIAHPGSAPASQQEMTRAVKILERTLQSLLS